MSGFQPKAEDLLYPEKLSAVAEKAHIRNGDAAQDSSQEVDGTENGTANGKAGPSAVEEVVFCLSVGYLARLWVLQSLVAILSCTSAMSVPYRLNPKGRK